MVPDEIAISREKPSESYPAGNHVGKNLRDEAENRSGDAIYPAVTPHHTVGASRWLRLTASWLAEVLDPSRIIRLEPALLG
jgi:hypothetical protein